MTTLTLPALDGRSTLGFLAACGILRLLTDNESDQDPPRLAWDPRTGQANITTDVDSLDQLIDRLADIAHDIVDDALVPGGPPSFPAGHGGPDPMRVDRQHFREYVDDLRHRYGDELIDTWVPAMVTDLEADDRGRVDITLFAAPSGQQKFNTMLGKSLQLVQANPELLREALVSWRRHDGVSGEYLDHQVLRSAADTTTGKSTEAGVPGATWLALMALPWLPVSATRGVTLSCGWQLPRKRRRPLFVWPLWRAALDPAGVRSLLSHPALTVGLDAFSSVIAPRAPLEALGVFKVQGAERAPVPGRNFAGVLRPVDVMMK